MPTNDFVLIFWSFSSVRRLSNNLVVFRFMASLRSVASVLAPLPQLGYLPSQAPARSQNFLGIEQSNYDFVPICGRAVDPTRGGVACSTELLSSVSP